MSAPLRSRNAPLITLGAIVSLLACTNARGQAAPEGFHAIPGMPFDISVYAGLYAPFGSMFDCGGQPCGYANGGSPVPPGQTVGLQKTIAVGSHLTVWPAKRFGIEATLAYAPSGVTMACRVPDCNAGHAITASARVVVPVVGVTSPRSFYLGAGVGYVALGGNAYNGVTGTTTTSPTVGAGLELKSASGPSVRIEAEVFLLRPRFRLESCDASDGICRVLPPSNGWTQRSQPVVILSVGWAFGAGDLEASGEQLVLSSPALVRRHGEWSVRDGTHRAVVLAGLKVPTPGAHPGHISRRPMQTGATIRKL